MGKIKVNKGYNLILDGVKYTAGQEIEVEDTKKFKDKECVTILEDITNNSIEENDEKISSEDAKNNNIEKNKRKDKGGTKKS